MSEGEQHLLIKEHISQAVEQHPEVTDLRQGHSLGNVKADLTFRLRDTPVAIEVQRSDVSWMNIVERTREYHLLHMHVL